MTDHAPEIARAHAPARQTQLAPHVTHVQGAIWACNCIVVARDGEALVVDACWSPADIAAVRGLVGERAAHVLVTHADIDHVCGVGAFPDATAVMGPDSAARVRAGSCAEEIASESAKWGLAFEGEPRADLVVEPDARVELGGLHVTTVQARGHAIDGLGYVVEEEGLFAVGDYLMRSQHPMVWWSFREARRTTERLLATLDRFDLRWIVPGHGPLLSVQEARTVGAEDLAYMEAVERVADEAQREGVSPREWHLAVESVPVPRPAAPDIEMLCPRLLNAAATFRDRDADGRLPWRMDMA